MTKPASAPHSESKAHTEIAQFAGDPALSLKAIEFWEDDVRVVLNYLQREFLPGELTLPVRRLRLLVGYESR